MIIFYIIKIRFFETKIQFTDETTIENTKFNHSFFKPFNNEPIKALIVLKDGLYGNMLLIASNKSIKIWNYKTSSNASIIPNSLTTNILSVIDLNNNIIAIGYTNGEIKIIDLKTNSIKLTLKHSNKEVNSLALVKMIDGTLVSATKDNYIKKWNYKIEKLENIILLSYPAEILVALKDNRLVSGSPNSKTCIHYLNINISQELNVYAYSIVELKDNLIAIANSKFHIEIWHSIGYNLIHTIAAHQSVITALVFNSDDILISGSHDNKIKLWNINSNTYLNTLEHHTYAVTCLALLSDGKLVSGSDDYSIGFWKYKTVKKISYHSSFYDQNYVQLF